MHPSVEKSINTVLSHGLKRLAPDKRPVMVVSHERSGTHFTMNSLAACFGYASLPWIDLDHDVFNINYHDPRILTELLQALARLRPANLIKSHHEFNFFADVLDELKDLEIVYVHRRPSGVLPSFWRFLHTLPWQEGPRPPTPIDFAQAAPTGRLMRYQSVQRATMIDRWAAHVSGWIEAAERHENVHVVRYEDLDDNYERAVRQLGRALGLTPIRLVRVPPGVNDVQGGPVAAQLDQSPQDRMLVWRLALARHPDLMARLGYASPPSEQVTEVGRYG